MQLLSNSAMLELAQQMLKVKEFKHSHFSDLTRQPNCAGCVIQLLAFNFPYFNSECLDQLYLDNTIGFFSSQLNDAQFGDLDNDEYWNLLHREIQDPTFVAVPKARQSNKRLKNPPPEDSSYVWPTGRSTDSSDFSSEMVDLESSITEKVLGLISSGSVSGEDPISIGGEVTFEEKLPFQYVLYPQFGGSVPAFSKSGNSEWVVCSCHKSAIDGIISLSSRVPAFKRGLSSDDALRREIAVLSELTDLELARYEIQYEEGVCHFCTRTLPKLATFARRHVLLEPPEVIETPPLWGMYFRLQCLKNGLRPSLFEGEENCWDLASPDIVQLFEEIKEAGKAYHQFKLGIEFPVAEEYRDLWKKLNYEVSNSWTRLYHYLENFVRGNFGIRPIGATGQQEDLLYKLVTELLPDHLIQRNYRPGWLEYLELDIWIPTLNLGIEYQGQQHYVAIEAWGGEEKLLGQQERDRRKVNLCAQNSVDLVEFRFDEKLTRSLIRERLSNWI